MWECPGRVGTQSYSGRLALPGDWLSAALAAFCENHFQSPRRELQQELHCGRVQVEPALDPSLLFAYFFVPVWRRRP